jgi:hypothetical protein
MVASCAGAALGCYLVSLNVASERASLEDVENRIVTTQSDIRLLQTEIGTRGRLAQLERWNVKVLALSAPQADQFLQGGFQLARLARPQEKLDVEAPVVVASAPAPQPTSPQLLNGETSDESGVGVTTAARLMRQASLKLPDRDEEPAVVEAASRPVTPVAASHSAPKVAKTAVATAARAAKPTVKPVATAAPKKAGDKTAAVVEKAMTKPVRMAKVDPLAPLPVKANSKKTARDSGTPR